MNNPAASQPHSAAMQARKKKKTLSGVTTASRKSIHRKDRPCRQASNADPHCCHRCSRPRTSSRMDLRRRFHHLSLSMCCKGCWVRTSAHAHCFEGNMYLLLSPHLPSRQLCTEHCCCTWFGTARGSCPELQAPQRQAPNR